MRRRDFVKWLWILLMALVLLLPANALAANQTEKKCTTEEEAARVMRAYLVKREDVFAIPVNLKIKDTFGTGDRDKNLDEAMDRIYELAFAETDKPYEGDYMREMIKGFQKGSQGSWNGDSFDGNLYYYCPLMTTADQEKAVDAKVADIMKNLALAGKSEYDKIQAIYDYICSHSTYDDEGIDTDDAQTAYGVLVEGKGTCSAYAMAVYRLMREAGIGCRYINASDKNNNNAAGHAWNIVRIGKLWYYVDATWDTDYKKRNLPYKYFLKGSKDRSYVDHEEFVAEIPKSEPDFWKVHPLSDSDYHHVDPVVDPAVDTSPAVTPVSEQNNDPGALNYLPAPRKLKVKARKNGTVVLTWRMTRGASGYQIRYSFRKSMRFSRMVTIKKASTLKKVIKKLKKRKYYFQIRAFRVLPDSTLYSAWSRKVVKIIK